MKLFYRGNSYDYNPGKTSTRPFQPVRASGSAYNLSYRGVSYRVDPNAKSAELPNTPVSYNLIYRGIAYLVNRTAHGKVTVMSQPSNTAKARTVSVPYGVISP
ncbi:MAG: DUF4278 domain-containing protein [Fischerella sp. CENA71]|nr:DUF4278 domain-containing protein [Fischerella sp. CENA71]